MKKARKLWTKYHAHGQGCTDGWSNGVQGFIVAEEILVPFFLKIFGNDKKRPTDFGLTLECQNCIFTKIDHISLRTRILRSRSWNCSRWITENFCIFKWKPVEKLPPEKWEKTPPYEEKMWEIQWILMWRYTVDFPGLPKRNTVGRPRRSTYRNGSHLINFGPDTRVSA